MSAFVSWLVFILITTSFSFPKFKSTLLPKATKKLKLCSQALEIKVHLFQVCVFFFLQDSLGGGFDSSQALVGELSQVGLWDRVLTSNQVASLARCGKITQGSVIPWAENGVDVYGGATKDPGEPCSKHSRSSQ